MADLSKIKLNGVEYDLKDAVARAAIGNALQVEVVEKLPTENIDENTLYLVPREQKITYTGTKTTTSAKTTVLKFLYRCTNLNSTYSINIIISQTLNEVTTQLLNYTNDNISFNITEPTTLYNQDNWQIEITPETKIISVKFTGELANWTKDSWSVELTLIENLLSNNLYNEYLYINNSWEMLNENINTFMIKGMDYVTAGQKSGTTLGTQATAEGSNTTASGYYSHAEGDNTTASGRGSHAEGNMTQATGLDSHAEGGYTTASSTYSHAEGSTTTASGAYSHAEGYGQMTGDKPISGEANATTYSVAGYFDLFNAGQTVSYGDNTAIITATSRTAQTITVDQTLSTEAIDNQNIEILGKSGGYCSHTEGYGTTVPQNIYYAHAEGCGTVAGNNAAHAEGKGSYAFGNQSHAEGLRTQAQYDSAHSEGSYSIAGGQASHAEGWGSAAFGHNSHTEGEKTVAQRKDQHVFGKYNITETGDTWTLGNLVEIVGNGTSSTPSNARTLDWSGNEWLAGKLTVGAAPVNDMDVATKQYVDTAMNSVTVPTVEDMANVTAMLASYGLNTTTTLSAAAAGAAELDSAVVQSV